MICRKSLRIVLYGRPRLFAGQKLNLLSFYIKQFRKIDLLIIDELWYVTLDLTAVELHFQLLRRISLKFGGCKRYYISSALT